MHQHSLSLSHRLRHPWGVALGWMLLSMAAAAQTPAPAEIEYAAPDQSVWTIRRDAQGQPDNPLFRVATQMFAKAGIPWQGRAYPAARLFKYLQDGTSQFSILVKAPALQACCLFSRSPVATAEIHAYHLADRAPPRKLDDLAGKRVIVVHGYSYGGLLGFVNDERNRITVSAALTHESAFKMLERGRADYVIDYAGPGNEVLTQNPMPGVQSALLSRQDVYLVLSRTYPDAHKVMERLEQIVSTLDVEQILAGPQRNSNPK